MRDVFIIEPATQILADDAYVVSYPHLLEYFSSKQSLDAGDVVRGAHMVYGWMPTILTLYPEQGKAGLDKAAKTLEKARKGEALNDQEIEGLASLVNNSLVGASKLLHFVAPAYFPIWDSNVYSFIHESRPHYYLVNSLEEYKGYVQLLKDLAIKPGFQNFHGSVQRKLGYIVSPMRALELVMFLNPFKGDNGPRPPGTC
ncbi:hypothetical protein C4Q28_06045 [Pseudomonas sp. SWI6]|uniref:hypothetical protein n=1 Tax=Pseudomonas sp. SWI6 TaxID=2083051 RepID=UPI000CE5D988|nr:hypothetical protein [Pseudomonas sp. SWI6]AVD81752.1 hypothetical protein C4Q28_06045 [Pseudomonas sp. SWI6]